MTLSERCQLPRVLHMVGRIAVIVLLTSGPPSVLLPQTSASILTFGPMWRAVALASKSATFSNNSSGAVTIVGVTLEGPQGKDFSITSDNCTGVVPGGATCTVTV